ncbi:S8 family serine peptidase [Micromonospora sp. NPDC047548]|uniref:S8 family peptidase n=1 Tax=Micromonospora sp. NPDC047548 TaxID=3155624 RepID=UPI0033CFB16A
MRSQRWRLRAAVTGAVVLALVAATGPTGTAAPPLTVPASTAPASPAGAASTGESPLPATSTPLAGATKVTLVTGDVVSYLPGANGGAPQVEVAAAPRAGGRSVSFTHLREGDAFYVFPSDARGLIGAGRLERGLFDVAYLVNNGYADDASKELPLIVQYPKSTRDAKVLSTKTDALPATATPKALPAVSSAAVKVTKKQAARFWASVDSPNPAGRAAASMLDAGVSKIWLDHKTKALLDQSVPQIGAPEAWEAGYDGTGVTIAVLDTGIDDTHPDLTGKVLDSKSFIDGEAFKDGHGHGTHVASTIVGSGAASGGKYKGVAPGAELIVGKVLRNDGYGSDSATIAGMQWAAQSGAKIVSISIGGAVTDGTDPVSQAVNELSAQYGTLFVIAAGNYGGFQQINTPGAADAALTVAAVDKQDQMASFSSRGPRRGDYGLKPDIAAPGVNITAAKADGTALGPIVDDKYTTISGTSMATPHVSGAAAILAQEHPDWTGQKIKQVITSTSKDLGHGAYSQGAGRVDVARATAQQVYATGNVDFGLLTYPQTGPASRTLSYANDGDAPVILDLSTTLVTKAGPAPAGALTVTPSTVTVPAHGTAEVTVTLDATKGELTTYQGSVHATGTAPATGGDIQVTTAVGGFKEPKTVNLSVNVINPPGATDVTYGGFLALRLDDQPEFTPLGLSDPVQSHTGELVAGMYSIGTDVTWRDADGEFNHALVTNPTVDATKDVSVTFDLRKAQRVTVNTPKPSVPYQMALGYRDVTENSRFELEQYYNQPYGETRLWTLPNGQATRGSFTSYTQFLSGADPVTMTVHGAGHTRLTPHYQIADAEIPKLDGRRTLPLVSAGAGLPADFEGLDARGKLVLLDLSDICPAEPSSEWFPCDTDGLDRVENAQRAGAAGVLGYGPLGRPFLNPTSRYATEQWWPLYPIPTMNLAAGEGRMLADMLAKGPVSLDVNATASTPYVYPLTFVGHDRMPGGAHAVTDRELYRIDNRLHADAPGIAAVSFQPILAGPKLLRQNRLDVTAPGTLTSYVGPAQKDLVWLDNAEFVYETGYRGWSQGYIDAVARSGSTVRDWGEQPMVPGSIRVDPATADYLWQMCMSCRNGNMLSIQHALSNNGAGGGQLAWARDPDGKLSTELHLYKDDGTEIPVQEGLWFYFLFGYFSPYAMLPAEQTNLRMTERYQTPRAEQVYARDVQTERTFTSQRRDDGFTTVPPAGVGIHCSGWFVHTPVDDEDGWADPILDPCQATDELYLGYDFDLDLDNTLPAGTRRQVTVAGYHSPYLTGPEPTLKSLKLWLSFDDGKHWKQVTTQAARDGTYTATFDHPALSKTTGAVSVRAEGVDSAGNTVTQTITRAYGLKAGEHHAGQ